MHSLEAKSCLAVGRIKYIIRELDQLRIITHQTIFPRTIIRWEEALMDISTTIKDSLIKWLVISRINHKTLVNLKFLEHQVAAWISYQNILRTKPHSK